MELDKLASFDKQDKGTITANGNDGNKTSEENQRKYPKRVFFIIGNEFCERFSYYGMRTVLVLYARNFLKFDGDTATSVFHAFTFFAYFFPLVGAVIADSYLGKYRTILYLSIVYVLGHVVKTIAAVPYIPSNTTHIALSMIGLFMIAVGTGGIKPCVSAFGGDQFHVSQTKYRSQFFAMFYFSINAGALISKFITPIFRADLECYPGESGPLFDECYTMAFGIPGLLMLIAVVLFLAGTKYYTNVPSEGSIFWKFCKCIWSACRNRWRSRNSNQREKQHWVDYADAPNKLKRDAKCVLKVLLLFTPLPFFWALFDQQGSRWTLQALNLDGHWGSFLVKPDQMDVVNPLLIVTLIPLFETTLYPLLRRLKINFTPLRRMTAGLILAGLSFVCASILQFEIDKGLTPLPNENQFSVRLINMAPCDINLISDDVAFNGLIVKPQMISDTTSVFVDSSRNLSLSYKACDQSQDVSVDVVGAGGTVSDIVISGTNGLNHAEMLMPTKKLENGKASLSFVAVGSFQNYRIETIDDVLISVSGERSNQFEIGKGNTKYVVHYNSTISDEQKSFEGDVAAEPGGVYTIILTKDHSLDAINAQQLTDVNPNTINMAWMIPQYVVITVGEVFLSVTGLEFAYTQAPPSMKSVVTSFWLLTVSFGNLIVLVIAKAKAIEQQAHEFLLFAGLIAVAAVVFVFLARRYTTVDDSEFVENDEDDDKDEQQHLVSENGNEKPSFSEA